MKMNLKKSTVDSIYNDTAVRKMIECIRVYNDGKLEVIFGGGYTVEERVEIIGRNKE